MYENKVYRIRRGVTTLLIGLFIISRIFHVPIPIISTLSVFHLFILIALVYFISGALIKQGNESKQTENNEYIKHEYEAKNSEASSREVPASIELRDQVDRIQLQYYQNVEKFSLEIRSAVTDYQLYHLDKMSHADYFYSLLKSDLKIEAMWSMDQEYNTITSIPHTTTAQVLTEEAKLMIEKNKVYVTPLDILFDSMQFMQMIIVPITNPSQEVVGHIGIQYRCF